MGLDIGYRVWKKQADGKLAEVKIENDSNWVHSCYNCRVAASWCDYRYVDKGGEDFCSEGVFDEDYDGAIVPSEEEGDYATKLFYLPFREFKGNVMDEVKSVEDDMADTINNAIRCIIKAKDNIKGYQELQLRSQSELVFDKYQALINEQRDIIVECEEKQMYYKDDYDYNKAQRIKTMINDITTYINKGFVVSVYYSY